MCGSFGYPTELAICIGLSKFNHLQKGPKTPFQEQIHQNSNDERSFATMAMPPARNVLAMVIRRGSEEHSD
jgi:hypothetical protein